jgi:hypothetical protein
MSATKIVKTMLEAEDPKEYAAHVPTALEMAIDWAHAEYNEAVENGVIYDAESADQTSNDIAMNAVENFDLEDDEDDNFDAVVTPLFARAGKEFPD